MSEPEWTKGPWFVDDDGEIRGHDPDGPDEPWYIAFPYEGVSRRGQKANARLIAAAPDLYEALENILGIADTPIGRRKLGMDADSEIIQSARAALSKARGE